MKYIFKHNLKNHRKWEKLKKESLEDSQEKLALL